VWAKEDRLSGKCGFHRVLAALRREAFSDEYEGRKFVPVSKFTGDIDEKHIRGLGAGRSVGAAGNGEPEGVEQTEDFRGALHVAWNENETKVRKLGASRL
jgi:hypothetical protein